MDVDTPAIKLDVLELVNDSRMTYGLRHQDFQRYRKHCTHRVQRLRQILHLTKPNNKKTNQQKELPEKITDARYLHLFVFEVERAWAYAMDLNQELSADSRKRHHTRKKLKRATHHAEALYQLCEQQDVEDRSKLEVKAYAAAMRGHLYFELQQWQNALNQFVAARTIYEHFASLSTTTQHEALCYSAIDDIDPSIRICAYNLRLNETSMANNVDELVKSLKKSDAAGENITSLEQQLSKISEQGAQSHAESLSEVNWRSRQATIKSDKVAKGISKAQETTKSTQLDGTDDAAISFDRVLASWADAEKLVKKALKEDKEATAKVASSKSAKSTEELQFIQSYVSYNLYAHSIQRNVQLVTQGDNNTQRKPQENVRLHDDILKHLESIRELLTLEEQDGQLDWELNVLTHYYRACRCLHVAESYASLNRIPEAVALYRLAQTYIAQAKQLLHQGEGFANDSVLTVSENDLVTLEQALRNKAWKTQASWYLKHGGSTAEHDLQAQMEQLNLDDMKIPLLEQLDVYPSTLSAEAPNLVEFPPRIEPAVGKPFFFDLAANHIQYPDALSEHSDKPSGLFSKFFGFGGK
ncbi:hypothetical protein BDA99DRAFT_151260 [Phascolomyces articulosus]|uniref:Signal recognition particle subunit SRP68 n=1 Tax=Phascolomyces articulosus TaxID=60185 RepID=A0AAD5PBI5_9FUNG|nr:hypothetical protein BDA99DRAFT_151260 [Phascolomyces articulosus]